MGVIFASLRLSGKEPVSMDLFVQLVSISNVSSLSFNIWIGISPLTDLLFLISGITVLKNWLKRETGKTVKFCFDVLYAGVIFIPFDDIINPIRTDRW